MNIQTKHVFEVIKGGPDAYIRSLPFTGKTIEQAKAMLPSGYNIQLQYDLTQEKLDKDYQPSLDYPDDSQYAVLSNTDANHIIIHLYVNGGVIDDTLEVYY
jgi:hypothetical protein